MPEKRRHSDRSRVQDSNIFIDIRKPLDMKNKILKEDNKMFTYESRLAILMNFTIIEYRQGRLA